MALRAGSRLLLSSGLSRQLGTPEAVAAAAAVAAASAASTATGAGGGALFAAARIVGSSAAVAAPLRRAFASEAEAPPAAAASPAVKQVAVQPGEQAQQGQQGQQQAQPRGAGAEAEWTEVVDQATGEPREGGGEREGPARLSSRRQEAARQEAARRPATKQRAKAQPTNKRNKQHHRHRHHQGRSYWWNESTGETTDLDAPRPKQRFHRSGFAGAADARFQDGWREPPDANRTIAISFFGAVVGVAAGWATQFLH